MRGRVGAAAETSTRGGSHNPQLASPASMSPELGTPLSMNRIVTNLPGVRTCCKIHLSVELSQNSLACESVKYVKLCKELSCYCPTCKTVMKCWVRAVAILLKKYGEDSSFSFCVRRLGLLCA